MGAQRKKLVGVTPRGDSIEVRFKYRGKTFAPRLRMRPTAANLQYAARVRWNLMDEIADGTFDLLKHFPDYRYATKLTRTTPTQQRSFGDWATVWESLAERELEHSSFTIYKRHLRNYWLSCYRDLHPSEITNEMIRTRLAELAREVVDPETGISEPGLKRKTQNNILIPLRAVFDLISRSPGAGPNPLGGIRNLKYQKDPPDPFTEEEVDRALAKVREMVGDEMADYFEFAAYAGPRPSEQIALLWGSVDLLHHTVHINRSKVMGQKKGRTKTFRGRFVELNARAAAVIERQRTRTQAAGQEVFINPLTGRPWVDDQVQCRVWKEALAKCGIRHRPPKELRDTSVTIALSSGADPWWVAAQHGHSLSVMQRDYALWIPRQDGGRNRAAVNRAIASPKKADGNESASCGAS